MEKKKYAGTIEIQFEEMPSIRLESVKPNGNAEMLDRLAIATRRRRFSLFKDWKIELRDIDYSDNLNGIVKIHLVAAMKKQ